MIALLCSNSCRPESRTSPDCSAASSASLFCGANSASKSAFHAAKVSGVTGVPCSFLLCSSLVSVSPSSATVSNTVSSSTPSIPSVRYSNASLCTTNPTGPPSFSFTTASNFLCSFSLCAPDSPSSANTDTFGAAAPEPGYPAGHVMVMRTRTGAGSSCERVSWRCGPEALATGGSRTRKSEAKMEESASISSSWSSKGVESMWAGVDRGLWGREGIVSAKW
mmetsp:Transcript_5923/g.14421  ORF Transcript_5923/g.14421 Transcript_5923/m.14421 type:complete len:222 (-) Transcript_5923:73-738(-)